MKHHISLYILAFILTVLSAAILIFSLLFLVLFYGEPNFKYFLTTASGAGFVLICCRPLWKEMAENADFEYLDNAESLLKSSKTPLTVRDAIHAFQNGIATLDDAITMAPYGIYNLEIYDLLKKQNFSFIKSTNKRFFIKNYQVEFLELLRGVRTDNLSSEDAIAAWSYELLTLEQTKEILHKNGEDYPETICALSDSELSKYRSSEEIIDTFREEKKQNSQHSNDI